MSLQTMIALCALIGHPNAPDVWWGIQLAGQPVGYHHEEFRLLRIVLEAISNTVRHASATRIDITLCIGPISCWSILGYRG